MKSPNFNQTQKLQSLIDENQAMKDQNKGYQDKINRCQHVVQQLIDYFQAEIKSIKHLAHIRELIRVAKERETAIDKDRMIIEIKQLK
jgi:hypothetical protein